MARPRDPETTRHALLAAAQKEFNTRGYFGTDTNRIARCAGFAPQTFYRHFDDKIAIFLAVYEGWWTAEVKAVDAVFSHAKAGSRALAAARVVLDFHVRWRIFRRSLRHLAVEDPRVRAARAAARKAQIERLHQAGRGPAERISALLTVERLCDAAADGELADLGLSQNVALTLVARAMAALTDRPPGD
jgi:AcrR family transcriptional regulator